jgi:hypothetical protein
VYVCLLPDDSSVVVPKWMFEAATCASMKLGTPRCSLRALNEVHALLTELGFHRRRTALKEQPAEAKRGESKTEIDRKTSTPVAAIARERTPRKAQPKGLRARRATARSIAAGGCAKDRRWGGR